MTLERDSETRLAARLAANLDGHFEALVRAYQDRLFGFALRMTASQQDAEESTQDAFVRAYRALEGYPARRRRELRLRPWLYQILLNVIRNRARRTGPSTVPMDGLVANGLAASAAEQPDAVSLRTERQAHLARAIARLPTRQGAAVVLRHVEGLSYAEAADVLGQPVGTIKSDVHRALRSLRAALEPELLLEAGRH